jgi:hypothetical protein
MSFIIYAFLMAFVHSKAILIEELGFEYPKTPFSTSFSKIKKIPNPTFLLKNIRFGNVKITAGCRIHIAHSF